MSVKDDLIRARAYVARGWTQQLYARDGLGHWVSCYSASAAAWCVLGALGAAIGEGAPSERWDAACNILKSLVPEGRISYFNDAKGRTKEEVLALYDKAIASVPE